MVKVTSFLLISLSATLLALTSEANNQNLGACFLHVPKHPLTADGLATPYILKKGNCDQTITNQQVFVEATVFDIDTKTFSVYHPLVINEGKNIEKMVQKTPKYAHCIETLFFFAHCFFGVRSAGLIATKVVLILP
jgi:hypothetical protein